MVIYSKKDKFGKVGNSFETEMLEYGIFLAFYYNFNNDDWTCALFKKNIINTWFFSGNNFF